MRSRREVRLAAIVELPNGSFQVPPKPGEVRKDRLIAVLSTTGILIATGLLLYFALSRELGLKYVAPVVGINAVLVMLIWLATRPATLTIDASEVSYVTPVSRKRMSRSEISVIFRGHGYTGTRSPRPGMLSFYVFIGAKGRVGLLVPARWFTEESMAAVAQRLNVPMRGDFSGSVRSAVDPRRYL
jgi:hypothetical protein